MVGSTTVIARIIPWHWTFAGTMAFLLAVEASRWTFSPVTVPSVSEAVVTAAKAVSVTESARLLAKAASTTKSAVATTAEAT